MKKIYAFSLFSILAITSCKNTKEGNENKEIEKDTVIVNKEESKTEISNKKTIKEFSWNDVPESNVNIGAFPYIVPPTGMMVNKNNDDTKSYDFHKLEMFDGHAFFGLEGRVEKMSIQMDPYDAAWNQYLFDTSVSKYLESIGAKLISDKKIPQELMDTWGDTNAKYEHMNKFYAGDVVNDMIRMYVLKTASKKIGFHVYSNSATAVIGVVEMKNFKQTIEKITADDILSEINTKGFATLHINFDTSKSRIKADSYSVISEIAKMMKANRDLKISIEGHTDNIGDEKSNMKLSKNRAKSVLMALTDEDIDEARLKSEGFGQTKPLKDNSTEEGRAENRRVELRKI